MEPAIGNERLALAELMARKPARIYAGPDVWTPISEQYPLAFDTDKAHPNYIGAEIMAHYWFKALLEREGLKAPQWSHQEMEDAIRDQPMGITRDNRVFQQKLSLTRHGYAVVSINYRLSGEAVFPAQIHDCKGVIRWLRANASKFDFDTDHIGVAGSSAGGHLAALLGSSGGAAELEGTVGGNLDRSSRVQAVCDMWGPTDFLRMGGGHNKPTSPESKLIGGPIQENQAKVSRANPITYVDPSDPPMQLIHGEKDGAVPVSQSELLHRALTQAGVDVELHVLKDTEHGGRGFSSDKIRDMALAFFDKHLKVALRD